MAGVTMTLLNYLSQHWYVSVPVLVLLATVWWWRNRSANSTVEALAAEPRVQSVEMRTQQTQVKQMRTNVIDLGGVGDSEEYTHDDLVAPSFEGDLPHVPYKHERRTLEDSYTRSKEFYELMDKRRSVRFFTKEAVPKEVIENIVRAAGTAPSGAHTEPWRYVCVRDPDYKQKIRELVEEEEEVNYRKRMGSQWVQDLQFLRTNHVKEYLTDAAWIIFVFKEVYSPLPDGRKRNNYYHEISTALSGGILLAAIQNAGLVALTSTPLNCGPALKTMLERPVNEKLLLLLPVGYPARDCLVPDLKRKDLTEIMTVF